MWQEENEIEALGVKVAVVTFEAGLLARLYVRETNLSWPLLVDQSRKVYAAYGMEHATWWDVFGPASLWKYARLLLRGRRLHRSEGDVFQRGGDVLIDPEGVVRVHHIGSGPADRPSVPELLNVVRSRRRERQDPSLA